jgi:putative hydrolase of the HAD superfamily
MPAVQNIIFDLGGVILNLDIQRTRDAFTNLGFVQINDLLGIGHAGSFIKQHEIGAITDEEFIELARGFCHPGTTTQQVIDAWNALLLDFPPERVHFLHGLKNRYRIFLFSNTNAIHQEAFQKEYRGAYGAELDDHFEKAWYSHRINLRKPDVAAFDYVVANSGITAADTLFIDDALVNVEGARKAGLQALHLTGGKTILDIGL